VLTLIIAGAWKDGALIRSDLFRVLYGEGILFYICLLCMFFFLSFCVKFALNKDVASTFYYVAHYNQICTSPTLSLLQNLIKVPKIFYSSKLPYSSCKSNPSNSTPFTHLCIQHGTLRTIDPRLQSNPPHPRNGILRQGLSYTLITRELQQHKLFKFPKIISEACQRSI
jgi:hypothetical protein